MRFFPTTALSSIGELRDRSHQRIVELEKQMRDEQKTELDPILETKWYEATRANSAYHDSYQLVKFARVRYTKIGIWLFVMAWAFVAVLLLSACTPGGGSGLTPRQDPNPGIEFCRDTERSGYQRVCIEFTTYCDGLGTPFPITVDIIGVGLDLREREYTDDLTGQKTKMALHLVDETKMTEDGDQAILVVAFDYPIAIPPTLLKIAALTASTATRGCDMFVAMSSPQTRLHPHGTGLLPTGGNDMDYFLAEQDFIPMTATLTLEVPYLLPPA